MRLKARFARKKLPFTLKNAPIYHGGVGSRSAQACETPKKFKAASINQKLLAALDNDISRNCAISIWRVLDFGPIITPANTISKINSPPDLVTISRNVVPSERVIVIELECCLYD